MAVSEVIVIGGGVLGLSTAYQLAQRGVSRITLLEKGAIGHGSSIRAAGIGTHLLWSETGVRTRKRAFELYEQFSAEWDDYTFHSEHGCLNLFTQNDWSGREPLLPLYDRLDVPYEVLSGDEIHRRWPALTPPSDFVGLYDPRGGYSEPDEYVAALVARVRDLGVRVIEGATVLGFEKAGDRVAGVRTAEQSFHADAVVSTVHAWSLPLLNELGISLPIKHFVHQRYVTVPQPNPHMAPPVNADPYCGYVRPAAGNRLLMGVETPLREEQRVNRFDFRMSDLETPSSVREEGRQNCQQLVPALQDARWESEQVGLICFTVDGEPVLGEAPGAAGLFIAAAFHSGGFSYNSVVGELMADLVVKGESWLDLAPFSPSRFDMESTYDYLLSTVQQAQAVRRRH
ncbi:NAD(P)/FAD-dependent oxidoreductase [Lacipirellula parvula]|uniref:FAD dependent oxidoreductase domain-containing protein n=1 Tax=Lacipirellula parvula TaxID=2650471 RepID=A0A5K7XC79_9BACT|nr:FAD-binding oxidoreductase [Lacipirellula parvula]BBO33627.1 hypothetical protein PLANPX_3239 [Lacipirellula parvula]